MSSSEVVSDEMAAMLSTCPVRRLWVEQDEGPYHREAQPARRDVVEDREGAALQLGLRLARGSGDQPLDGAMVEIWHCDALGRYSGFPPPGPTIVAAENAPRVEYLSSQTFLRGRQRSDAAGMVEFRTIYPGWYPGRTVHIHVMVHVDDVILTSQLYFPDNVTDEVLSRPPYAERPGRDTTNDTDEILPVGGDPAVLDITPVGAASRAAICLVVPAVGRTP